MIDRVLSLDIGERSIGMAVSDPFGSFSIPIGTIKRSSKLEDVQKVKKIIEEKQIKKIVAGLPLDLDGNKSSQASIVLKFTNFLTKVTGFEVEFVDERYTTKMANDTLRFLDVKMGKQKGAEDALAAAYILDIYLKKH
ncbi:MAG: Holliday junction resolvase RuvX [Ezakiella sp.]|nr:Holliday junction resolvase RuvX [Bacillota bacterium]MDY3923749.1 Holliday junction resolvase RuvX [Ezakiella sp.]MDY5928502.1 Holliday junction resolvase RuvX [Candidatus Onthovivens sp.]